MRDQICYRSLIMKTLPSELFYKIFGEHLNCAQAHAFLSQYFLKKNKTERDILEEEEVWRRVGEIHFPNCCAYFPTK